MTAAAALSLLPAEGARFEPERTSLETIRIELGWRGRHRPYGLTILAGGPN